jgi:Tat protein translocase TatC
MREVRMTFGEHLEDLRLRIIYCLLYLLVGVTISMIYGKQLMEVALQPHYRAIRAAERNRTASRMEKTVARLDELTSVKPLGEEAGRKPLVEGEIHWEVLFARDVALPQLARKFREPFLRTAEKVPRVVPSLPEEERQALAGIFTQLGSELSDVLVREFASQLEQVEFPNLPQRFLAVKKLLEETQASAGPSQVQKLVGASKDLSVVLKGLDDFTRFLDLRKQEVLRGDIPLDKLREMVASSDLPRALNEILASLEKDAKEILVDSPKPLIVLSYIESFSTYLKVALIVGVFLALPFILYELWKFVGAGLYPNEQKYVVTLLPFSLALFVGGALFGYLAMIPVGLQFLAGWGLESVDLSFSLGNYVGLLITLTLILGLVFQTPLVMIFLSKVGILSVEAYRKARRISYFIGVCLAVVLTPPDPFSWSLMALPMLLLYEVGILACRVLERRKPRGEPKAA